MSSLKRWTFLLCATAALSAPGCGLGFGIDLPNSDEEPSGDDSAFPDLPAGTGGTSFDNTILASGGSDSGGSDSGGSDSGGSDSGGSGGNGMAGSHSMGLPGSGGFDGECSSNTAQGGDCSDNECSNGTQKRGACVDDDESLP